MMSSFSWIPRQTKSGCRPRARSKKHLASRFRGSGYPSRDAAERRGTELCFALRLAALRAGVGVSFMERQSFPTLSLTALEAANAVMPENVRVINEHAGVHVHRTEEQLVAFGIHGVGNVVPRKLPAEEREPIAELARHVESSRVVADTKRRAALANRVRGLRRETGRSAGLHLVQRLEPRRYAGMPPGKLFDRVYELRSRLSHGDAPPWRDVGDVSSDLWLFVRDPIDLEFTSPTVMDEEGVRATSRNTSVLRRLNTVSR